ncbi:MAG: hypothetical protein HFJ80_05970 [Clostridiales bacterium]|nr:hypothetical protein [Clostridiales bacterium]
MKKRLFCKKRERAAGEKKFGFFRIRFGRKWRTLSDAHPISRKSLLSCQD